MPGLPRPLLLPEDLRGRRAVVTGAARGIGYAITRLLIDAGAHVIAVDKDQPGLEGAFVGDDCERVVQDVAHVDGMEALASKLVDDAPVELLVNNVGITTHRDLHEMGRDDFDVVYTTNLLGPLLFTKRLVRALIEARAGELRGGASGRSGSIVFISSLHDTFVSRRPHYSATKAGVTMLVRELAFELGEHAIRVNAIAPGWIQTAPDIADSAQQRKATRMVPLIPIGRPGDAMDVARCAIFLLSDAWSSYVTGASITIDGGLSLHTWMDAD